MRWDLVVAGGNPAGLQIVLDAGHAGGDDAENSAVNRTVVR
jgi:N-acetylmuramoyl-L-alanine amidase